MGKRIGRRELINSIKGLRKEVQTERGRTSDAYQMLDKAENRLADAKNDFVRRLARLEGRQDIEYIKGPDSGTFVTTAMLAPEHFKMECNIPKFANDHIEEFARQEVCSKLAMALVENGLVRIQMEPDYMYGGTKITARVDVLPWDKLCRSTVKLHTCSYLDR